LPSLYLSGDRAREWSVTRAMAYGAAIGAVAALFKTLGPFRSAVAGRGLAASLTAGMLEIAAAMIAFAVLCGGASAVRNFIARRLIWPDLR
jgi:hypothetical protein